MTPPPPRLATWLIGRFLPATLRETVLGDLAESHARRLVALGRHAANRGYWREGWAAVRNLSGLSNEPTALTPPRGPLYGIVADARFALRFYGRRPLTATLVVGTLGLAIGGATAVFSVIKPVLLDPLPYPNGHRLAFVWERNAEGASNLGFTTIADLSERSTTLGGLAPVSYWQPTWLGDGDPIRLAGQKVGASFFGLLGVAPALGRDFLPEDDHPGADRVAIISGGLWQRRFGGDPRAVGRAISLGGTPHTIVGVLPDDFESLLTPGTEIWAPLRYDRSLEQACRSCRHLRALALLGPGRTLAAARGEIAGIGNALGKEFPREYGDNGFELEAVKANLTRGSRTALWLLFSGVFVVLALAAANVANLLLGQAVQRRHEFAVRMALGSGTDRLIRQVLIEAVLLGLGGAAVALALTGAGAGMIRALAADLPRASVVRLDWSVWLFGGLMGLVTGTAFGLLPARSSLAAAIDGLHLGRRATGRHSIRRSLIVAEVALASVLVIGSLLLTRSMARLLSVDLGFRDRGILTAQLQTAGPAFQTDTAVWRYYGRVREAVTRIPGVVAVGLNSQLPLGGNFDYYGVRSETRLRLNPDDAVSAARMAVTPGYFETMGIRLVEGRTFAATDRLGSEPVAVVNEQYAKSQFPGQSALGERITVGGAPSGGPPPPWRAIVGVVSSVKIQGLDEPDGPQIYLPHDQWIFGDDLFLAVRTEGDPVSLGPMVKQAIRSLHQDPTIERVVPMAELVSKSIGPRRLVLRLFLAFGTLALVLAAVGIYGVMASGVAERARELGIRAALGATASTLRRSVLLESVGLGLGGMVIGLSLGGLVGRVLGANLYGFVPFDLVAYAGTALALVATVLAGAWVPSARAARHDPAQMLRLE